MISSLELARLCGVSQGTVDRALHDRPGISAATRERILAMARKHGYAPNPAAREMLGLSSSNLTAVILPESSVQSSFIMDLIGEVARHLRPVGMRLSLWPIPYPYSTKDIEETAARRPRALIVVLPQEGLVVPRHVTGHLPVITLLLPNSSPGVFSLIPDEQAIGRAATRHLLDLGHHRIAHLSFPNRHWAVRERAAGYDAAMRTAKMGPVHVTTSTDPAAQIDLAGLRAAGITAVFTHNDPLALSLCRQARAAGWTVPGDLSVIGVDHNPTFVGLDPTLTTVAYPFAGIAAQVAAVITGAPLPTIPAPVVIPGTTAARLV